MLLDHLALDILQKVAAEPGISIKSLCQRIGLQQRNFYYRRTRINHWLVAEGFSPLHYEPHRGVRLNDADVENVLAKLNTIHARYYRLSADERRDNLFLHLACRRQPLFTKQLSDLNRVSRNTTLDDLNVLRHELQQQKLDVLVDKKRGYYITGSDLTLRLAVQQNFQHALKYADHQAEHRIIKALSVLFQPTGQEESDIHQLIDQELCLAESASGWTFSDKDKRLLHYMIMFSLVDSLNGHLPQFTVEQSRFLREQRGGEAAARMNTALSQMLSIPVASGNTLFFLLMFSASKKVTAHPIYVDKDARLAVVVRDLVQQFQALSGVYLQDVEQLESRLLSHLGPAIFRCLFDMRCKNALKEESLLRYPLLFRLCRRIIARVEQEYLVTFCDDELSYIVISFAAWMDRRPETSEQHILLVTEGGLSSTAILENQLRNLTVLPVHIERITASQLQQQGVGHHIRLVVSTTALSRPIPAHTGFIQTPHMLSEGEKRQLRQMLEHNIGEAGVSELVETLVACAARLAPQPIEPLRREFSQIISHFIQKQQSCARATPAQSDEHQFFVNFTSSQSPWHQLIRKAAQPLRERGIIGAQYTRNIIRQIERHGITTYLTPDILLLHDVPPACVTEGALSLLKLKHPLRFELPDLVLTPTVIVILVPTTTLSHIPLLEAFNALISDDLMLERLLNARSQHEVEHCIHDWEQRNLWVNRHGRSCYAFQKG